MTEERRAVPPAEELTRRDVIGIGVVAGAGLIAAAFPVVRYLGPVAVSAAGRHVEIPADALELWQPERILMRGSPGFVLRTPDRIYACSGVCTHLGCIVKWKQSQRIFFCPCHGARFAPDGRVLGGPAPRPLPRYDVEVIRGKILVEVA